MPIKGLLPIFKSIKFVKDHRSSGRVPRNLLTCNILKSKGCQYGKHQRINVQMFERSQLGNVTRHRTAEFVAMQIPAIFISHRDLQYSTYKV